MSLEACVVDAFAEKPFTGNPAAVVRLDGERDDEWRRAVAAEFNLSETAFLEPAGAAWRLRWFTPTQEVPLCGHATLAAAHALWSWGAVPPAAPLAFDTASGRLEARRDGEHLVIDLPADPPRHAAPPPGLLAAVGETPLWLGETAQEFVLEMDSEDTVRRAAPSPAALKACTTKGLVLTAPSKRAAYDVVSRCFYPSQGIDEDPVTGSAHCAVGPYWAERLKKPVLAAYQASKRGGVLLVRPKGARVELGGRALTVWTGKLL
ncbi:MAG: PhzF family phenazine biosynthesis protein [Elusimicrobiota bacterium]|nr:PhzF family phenazine biosynthesis protein [Elusimicrobiota bacterium]